MLSKTDCECHDYVTYCRILVGSVGCPVSDVGGKDGAAQHRADDGVVGGTGASVVDCERLDVSLGLEPFTLPGEEEVRAGVSVMRQHAVLLQSVQAHVDAGVRDLLVDLLPEAVIDGTDRDWSKD